MYSFGRRVLFQASEAALGRRTLVRTARALLDYARLDVPNVLGENGEERVQRAVLQRHLGQPAVVVDVGANRGQWSRQLLRIADTFGATVRVHALEPSAFTYRRLLEEAPSWAGGRLVPVNAAASDAPGRACFYTVARGAGSNSFHADPSWRQTGRPVEEEVVEVVTVDGYCEAAGLGRVEMLKSDAEGHDLRVLQGAGAMLAAGRIGLVQFEYNHRWVLARAFLRDAFELLEPMGFRLGKVSPRGVEWYDGWDPELETFREANYVAARLPETLDVPAVRWWKRDG